MTKRYTQGACPSCHSSDAYTTYDDGGSKCFSCNRYDPPAADAAFFKQRLAAKPASDEVALPHDFDNYLPPVFKDWLDSYGITQKERIENKVGYSAAARRLILPLYDYKTHLLVGYQARLDPTLTETNRPKYITNGNSDRIIHLTKQHEHDRLVVVEDIISAIKVGRYANTMPMLGSGIGLGRSVELSKRFSEVTLWMDKDARRKSILEAFKTNQVGMATTVLFSEKDPKEHTDEEIKEYLKC